MSDPNEIHLCTFQPKRVSRTEIEYSLVFKDKSFQIQVSQDYETQAKIEFSYSDADMYLAGHLEYRDKAKQAVSDCIAKNPDHAKAMKAALAQMKNL